MIDPSRLSADEREVWDEYFPDRLLTDAPHFLAWEFGAVCHLELGRVPDVVVETLGDSADLPTRYAANMRRWLANQRRPTCRPSD